MNETTSSNWTKPKGFFSSLFSRPSSSDISKLVSKNAALESHISLLIKSQQKVQSKYFSEREAMQKEIRRLKSVSEENLKVVVLTQKAARKKAKIASLKKQVEYLTSELTTHTAMISELKQDMHLFKEKSIKSITFLRNQMNMLAEKLNSWQDVKLLFVNPNEIQDLIKQREFFKGAVFPLGNEYLADNICKLQVILKEKMELLERNSVNEKVIEELECPYKKNVGILESQAEELKGRIDVLERKEKLLNKMFTSNVVYTVIYSLYVQAVNSYLLFLSKKFNSTKI